MPCPTKSTASRDKRNAGRSRKRPPAGPRRKPDVPQAGGICVRRTTRRGRGVFALRDFAPDETIEVAPVLLIPQGQQARLNRTDLKDYYFKWGNGFVALALGFGSLYNHSADPNADYLCHPPSRSIVFTAARPIAAGEEILIDYDCALWFDVR